MRGPLSPSCDTINNLVKDINSVNEINALRDKVDVVPERVDAQTYVLPDTPSAGTEKIFINGLRVKRDADYTLSGNTISLTVGLDEGEIITIDYKVL